ncbi:hypothetical protein [Celerinatantimonas sp. YJH-8]|uniref:hypothetical protein n=1 Tax=Celerinatantimonas sp. YJH-8 TaxID=3228714 RepID=UPI0038C20B6D
MILTPFGRTIRKIRVDLEMTLIDHAKRANLSPYVLTDTERGQRKMEDHVIHSMLGALPCSPEDNRRLRLMALEETGYVLLKVPTANDAAKQTAAELSRTFEYLTDEKYAQLNSALMS